MRIVHTVVVRVFDSYLSLSLSLSPVVVDCGSIPLQLCKNKRATALWNLQQAWDGNSEVLALVCGVVFLSTNIFFQV